MMENEYPHEGGIKKKRYKFKNSCNDHGHLLLLYSSFLSGWAGEWLSGSNGNKANLGNRLAKV